MPLASLAVLGVALVVAILAGFTSGSILATLIAAGGAVIGGYGVWQGMQKESQKPMALALLGLLGNLGLAGVLIVLKIIHVVF